MFCCFFLGKTDKMLPKSRFSKPIFGHSAGSTKLDRPYCKRFWTHKKGSKILWGNPKQPVKLQQPRNYDFWMFQFNLLASQGSNSREMTTSPPGQSLRGNSCTHSSRQTTKSPSQQPWNDKSETQRGAWDFASFHGCCRFKCLLGFSDVGQIFGALFARNFVARKTSFVQTSFCRRATLTITVNGQIVL